MNIMIVGDRHRANEYLDLLLTEGIKDIIITTNNSEPLEPMVMERLKIPEMYVEPFKARKPRRRGQKNRPTW